MRRTKEEAARTREQLLRAALTVFRTRGYTTTTLDDIATAAGVTRGAIYWHFGGKAELYNMLVSEHLTRAYAVFERVLTETGTPIHRLRRCMCRFLEYLEEDADYRTVLELKLLMTETTADLAEGYQQMNRRNDVSLAMLTQLIQASLLAGEVKPGVEPHIAARAIQGFLAGITSLWLQQPTSFSVKATAPVLVDTFLSGIANDL
jgi:TetR/AcrR family acrAB operon transcriptional repressor